MQELLMIILVFCFPLHELNTYKAIVIVLTPKFL